MKQVFSIRLEQSEVDRIKEIAIEGNVSQWIRLLIRSELESITTTIGGEHEKKT